MSSSPASEEAWEKCVNNASSIRICPLCKMFLQNPAQVPCGHNYCTACVVWLLRNILDPECLICGKKIVTDDAIFNFGSIKPDKIKSEETERLAADLKTCVCVRTAKPSLHCVGEFPKTSGKKSPHKAVISAVNLGVQRFSVFLG